MMGQEDEIFLPILRSDIQLNEAPAESEGAPTWTLYDPAANKYYKIGWLEFECLSRFKQCETAGELAELVRKETTLEPDEDNIKSLILFLIYNNLVQASGVDATAHFESQRDRLHRPWWERLLHSYLFFTVPLFKPQAFLKKTYPYVKFFLTRQFMALVFILLAYGIFLSVQRLDELVTTFMNYLSFEGMVLLLVSAFIIKFIHELGHAYTATKYGVPVTIIGVAFIVLYPILYTETTNAWKMKNRRHRLCIAGAGLMAEFALAAVALLLWHVLSPGIAQSICFMIAIVSLGTSLLINLNPLMRFDGYYLFSDMVGVDNLQERSFAISKWKLRNILWGWDDPPPESLPKKKRDFLAAFGYATWVYRFFLYLGIGLIVYHIFFQPLGLILMIVELGFFIGLPILREVFIWLQRFEDIAVSWHGKTAGFLLLVGLGLCFIPVNRTIEVPAVMHAGNYIRFYTPIAAKLDEVLVKSGDKVYAGQALFRLSSPELDYNIEIVSKRLENLREIRASSQASPELAKKRVTIDSEIDRARKELDGYLTIRSQLQIEAPFAGQIKDVDPALHPGQWVASDLLLGLLADQDVVTISGYVRERDVARLPDNVVGVFYPEYSPLATKHDVNLKQINQTGINEIFWSELSSLHSGPVPSERGGDGKIRPLPRYTFYAAEFNLVEKVNEAGADFVTRGAVRLTASPQSVAKALFDKGVSFFIEESGF